MLVSSAIKPANSNKEIIAEFQEKITKLTFKLLHLKLSHQQLLFRYNVYWWPSICYMAPALTLLLSEDILRLLHTSFLSKLGVNRNFPCSIILVAVVAGGLGLQSLEFEQGLEYLGHITSL